MFFQERAPWRARPRLSPFCVVLEEKGNNIPSAANRGYAHGAINSVPCTKLMLFYNWCEEDLRLPWGSFEVSLNLISDRFYVALILSGATSLMAATFQFCFTYLSNVGIKKEILVITRCKRTTKWTSKKTIKQWKTLFWERGTERCQIVADCLPLHGMKHSCACHYTLWHPGPAGRI